MFAARGRDESVKGRKASFARVVREAVERIRSNKFVRVEWSSRVPRNDLLLCVGGRGASCHTFSLLTG